MILLLSLPEDDSDHNNWNTEDDDWGFEPYDDSDDYLKLCPVCRDVKSCDEVCVNCQRQEQIDEE